MKAVRMHGYGGPEVLSYDDVPLPQPVADQILVRVHAASVNPVDWKIREGYFHNQGRSHSLPHTLGCDFAGVVESVGEFISQFKPGDAVYGYTSLFREGTYAEYVLATEAEIALKPRSLDFVGAAALPVVALTAWQALFEAAHLTAGQTVLVHAAAGGVGSMAVQFAKAIGATVIGTASGRNADLLRDLGVSEVIDYQTTAFERIAQNVDVVLDTMGGETQARSFSVLKPGGFLVSIVQPPPEQSGIQVGMVSCRPDAAQLKEIAALVDAGKVRPLIDTVLPLREVQQAHELSKAGRTRGKIVLRVG